MSERVRILLQSTITDVQDDWHVGRFSLLRDHLRTVADVVARNREPDARGDDPVLSTLRPAEFDEVWLMAVDAGAGVSQREREGIAAFQREGGGLLTARDHQNMGMWLRQIEGVGQAHFFNQQEYCEPDVTRLCPDDRETPTISWPNYHSGRNGDFQRIVAVEPLHDLLKAEQSASRSRGAVPRPPARRCRPCPCRRASRPRHRAWNERRDGTRLRPGGRFRKDALGSCPRDCRVQLPSFRGLQLGPRTRCAHVREGKHRAMESAAIPAASTTYEAYVSNAVAWLAA